MLMPKLDDVVRFGDFELDVRAYALRRNGEPVRLERRPMDLLIFLVERHGELVTRTDIVDQLWGRDVFIEVEPAVNTAIKKIRRALDDSADTPSFVETVPGKGYRFVAPVTRAAARPVSSTAHDSSPPAGQSRRVIVALGLGALVVVVALAGGKRFMSDSTTGSMHVVALTTLVGLERGAAFSPDARQVAFTWSGEALENWDIYVKVVGTTDLHRLTSHVDRDLAPRWSFDGRQIAYLRQETSGEVEHLRVMSALGGSDRQVSSLNVLPAVGWSPDDRWIAAGVPMQPGQPGGIYLFPVDGGEPRRMTEVQAGRADFMAAFSADGRYLAYASCADFLSNCHIHIIPLDDAWRARAPSRRLTDAPVSSIRGVTWTRDSSSVIYGAIRGAESDLWRIDVSNGGPPQRIEMAGARALFPGAAATANRLAFSREIIDEDVYAFETGGAVRPVARSSVFDGNAQFSPDGKKIAFCSSRTVDATEVWIADADGSAAEQLTRGPGRFQCSPSWSPDGRSVAFESHASSGESQILSIDVNVRQPTKLTSGPGDRKAPTWSRDGESVYFSWDQGKGREIWRVPGKGGAPQRMTTGGSGLVGVESIDGATLFYLGQRTTRLHEPTDGPLLAQPLGGGQPHEVVPCIRGTAFSVAQGGIYYLPCRSAASAAGDPAVVLRDLVTGRERALGTLAGYENRTPAGFSASSDGRAFLYNRLAGRGEDLMMIENFR